MQELPETLNVLIVALFTCALQDVTIHISCVLCIKKKQQSTLVPILHSFQWSTVYPVGKRKDSILSQKS
jgi:hypothetical protein